MAFISGLQYTSFSGGSGTYAEHGHHDLAVCENFQPAEAEGWVETGLQASESRGKLIQGDEQWNLLAWKNLVDNSDEHAVQGPWEKSSLATAASITCGVKCCSNARLGECCSLFDRVRFDYCGEEGQEVVHGGAWGWVAQACKLHSMYNEHIKGNTHEDGRTVLHNEGHQVAHSVLLHTR